MPTKASITTRTAKGSPLSTAEMDGNLEALRDQSIGFADDTSTVLSVDSGNTITIAGGTNITTAITGTTLTVTGPDLTSYITASSSDALTNKTIDANGTGNSITNLEVADFAGSAIITVAETLAANDSDTAVVTAGAIIDYVDAQDANIASDSLVFTNKTFDANASGNALSNVEVADLASGVLDTDLTSVSASDDTLASAKAIKTYADTKLANIVEDTTPQLGGSLDVNSQKIVSLTNGTIELEPNGTGDVLADIAGGGTVKVSYGKTFTSGYDDALPGRAITLEDTSDSATLVIDQYNQHTPAPETQYFSVFYDTTGAYTYPVGATSGDVAMFLGYNFDTASSEWVAQGGDLYISALNHTDYTEKNIYLNTPLAGYKEAVETLTDDSTADIHIDCSVTTVSTFSLNDNKTFVFTNLDVGRSHTLIITNQGSHTATLQGSDSSAILFPGGAPTITTGAGAIDVITVFYDGTNYLGNIAQNFS